MKAAETGAGTSARKPATGGSVVVRVTGDAPGIVIGTTSAVDVEVAMPVEGWSSL